MLLKFTTGFVFSLVPFSFISSGDTFPHRKQKKIELNLTFLSRV